MSTALLIIRIAVGFVLVAQGAAKLTKEGRSSTAAFFDDAGFLPAAPLAVLAGLTEVATGALFMSGLLVAIDVKRPNGYWDADAGYEYPLFLAAVAAGLAFSGAGALSLDEVLGWSTPATITSVAAVALGVASSVPLMVNRSSEKPRCLCGRSQTLSFCFLTQNLNFVDERPWPSVESVFRKVSHRSYRRSPIQRLRFVRCRLLRWACLRTRARSRRYSKLSMIPSLSCRDGPRRP